MYIEKYPVLTSSHRHCSSSVSETSWASRNGIFDVLRWVWCEMNDRLGRPLTQTTRIPHSKASDCGNHPYPAHRYRLGDSGMTWCMNFCTVSKQFLARPQSSFIRCFSPRDAACTCIGMSVYAPDQVSITSRGTIEDHLCCNITSCACATDRVGDRRVQLFLLEAHEGGGKLRLGPIEQTALCIWWGGSEWGE